MSRLRRFWDGPSGRTWLAHAALGALYTLVAIGLLRLLPAWAVPGAFTMFFYALREIEGIAYTGRFGTRREQVDHLLDVLSPTAAALVLAGVLWALGVRWR